MCEKLWICDVNTQREANERQFNLTTIQKCETNSPLLTMSYIKTSRKVLSCNLIAIFILCKENALPDK